MGSVVARAQKQPNEGHHAQNHRRGGDAQLVHVDRLYRHPVGLKTAIGNQGVRSSNMAMALGAIDV